MYLIEGPRRRRELLITTIDDDCPDNMVKEKKKKERNRGQLVSGETGKCARSFVVLTAIVQQARAIAFDSKNFNLTIFVVFF